MPQVHDDITLGRRIRTWRLGGLTVHKVRYDGEREMPRHAHRHSNLTFILGGAIEETTADGTRCLHACDAVIKPAGTMHCNRLGPRGSRSIVVEFDERWPGKAAYAMLTGPRIGRNAVRIARALDDSDAGGEVAEAVMETLALGPESDRGLAAGPAGRARSMLHDGFAMRLRVQELAAMLQLHPVYLARAFRREFGCTITAYRRRLQVGDAARRLSDSDESLVSIATRSGFADQSHMCRAFCAAYGVPPGEFRRVIRN